MAIPINRTTDKISDTEYRVFAKSNPHYYKTDQGTFEEIDLTFNDATSKIGDISLMRKNVFSVGIRKDKDPSKYIGIRPDNNQNGDQQIELSVENVKIDGSSIDLDLDDFDAHILRGRLFHYYKSGIFKDIEIQYKIHLTGVEIANEKHKEETLIRKDLKTEFINLGQDTGSNILDRYASDSAINDESCYIRFYYGQITDDFITTGEYNQSTEFGSNNLSNYTLHDLYKIGGSTYLKNSIVFYMSSNIDEFDELGLINICNKYDLEIKDDKYFYKNNKKVGAYLMDQSKLLGYINTQAIPENVKTLFIRKTFDQTDFIDLTLDQFEVDLKNQFNYNLESISVDHDYYKGDNYYIKISNNYYIIDTPLIMDFDKQIISEGQDLFHSLKDLGDGSYLYTKFLTVKGALKNFGNTPRYVDVDIESTASDMRGYYKITGTTASPSLQTSANLTTMRNATSSNQFGSPGVTYNWFARKLLTKNSGSGGNNQTYSHYQCHISFDVSAISNATAVSWKHHSYCENDTGVSGDTLGDLDGISYVVAKSTKPTDTWTIANSKDSWNDWVGFTSSWDLDSDLTAYTGRLTKTTPSGTVGTTTGAWTTDDLNSDALTDLNADSTLKMGLMEYDAYADGDIDSSWTCQGLGTGRKAIAALYVNYATGYEHHLIVTAPAATDNSVFFGCNF